MKGKKSKEKKGTEGADPPPSVDEGKKKRGRGGGRPPKTEAERQFEEAAREVMCGDRPEAQHAFLLLHPRLLPVTSLPASPRRPSRRLFQLWLRELNSVVESCRSTQPSAEDLLKRQNLLNFMHVWVKHFNGDLSASRCSAALKAISTALSAAPPSASASPGRRPSALEQQRRQLNEFKLLFLQHRRPTKASSLESRKSSSPTVSPSITPRASVNLSSSPTTSSLLISGSFSMSSPSSASLQSSISSLSSPRSRHSSAVLPSILDDFSIQNSLPTQSASAELPAISSDENGKKNRRSTRLHQSDEITPLSSAIESVDEQPGSSPRGSDGGSEEDPISPRGELQGSSTTEENTDHSPRKRKHVSHRMTHARSDSMGAILSVSNRPGHPVNAGRRTPRLRFLDIPLDVLAEEMTAHEIRMMYAVDTREFIAQGWQKNPELNLAPNITALINRFNLVSFWATTEVLMKDTPQLMASTIKRMIKLAWKFHEMNNFNAIAEIVSGLNSAAIQRLSLWREVPEKYARRFREMDSLVQIKQNYRNYRDRIAELLPPENSSPVTPSASSASSASSLSPTTSTSSLTSSSSISLTGSSIARRQIGSGRLVPYFAVILRDVTFAVIGNPLYLPPVKVVSPLASRRKPVRRLSESDADDVKEDNAQEEEEEERQGGESPIDGGSVNMDRLLLMFDQVQLFERMRREMKGYEFLERKREKEDKEFARKLIRDYQADLPAIKNADSLYDLSLAAEGNGAPSSGMLSSTASRSRHSLASSIEAPAISLWSSSPSEIMRPTTPSSSPQQPAPSLVHSFSIPTLPTAALASSASTTVLSPRSRSIHPSASFSPPLSPSSLSSTSAIYVRSPSGQLRVRRASDDGSTTAAFAESLDGGSDDDDEGSEDEESKDKTPPITPTRSTAAASSSESAAPEKPKRKTRLRRRDVESIRRVISSPETTDDDAGILAQAEAAKKADKSGRRDRRSLIRRSSGALPDPSLGDLDSDLPSAEVGDKSLRLSSSSITSSTNRGARRAFTYRRATANASEGDLVAKVVVEIRSFVGNSFRPVLLTFRDSLEQFLAKATLRHSNLPVVSFVYEAPNSCSSSDSSSSALPGSASSPRREGSKEEKGKRVTVHDEEEFETFKRWALHQRERVTIDIWLIAGVY